MTDEELLGRTRGEPFSCDFKLAQCNVEAVLNGRGMRRIFLHAGEPKTGTTAIQLLLQENRESLERFGYFVPKSGVSPGGNHAGLIAAILGEPIPPMYKRCVEAFQHEVNANAADKIIVSAESLDYCFRNEEKSERILSFLRDLGLETTVVMFIRHDAEALSSAYAEQVKSFLRDITMRDFVRRQRRYFHLLRLAQRPGIRTIFRPYNAEVRRVGAGREFLRVIGVPEEAIECLGSERRVNESIGPIAVAVAREIRRRLQQYTGRDPTDQQRLALKTELFRLTREEEPEAAFYGVDTELLQEIESRVSEDREKFAQAAWGESWRDVFAFDESSTKQCNAFDAANAEPAALKKYQRMTEALWSAAQRIVDHPVHAKRHAWDRLQRQVPLWIVQLGGWAFGFCTTDLSDLLSAAG